MILTNNNKILVNSNRILNSSSMQFEPESIELFNRMSSQPLDSRKILINEIIFQLKINLIWDELDCIYFLAAHDSQSAKLNWKSSSFDLTELGTMNYSIDGGYTRNGVAAGTTDALNTNYTPSTSSIKATLNSNSFGIYTRTNVTEPTADFGSIQSNLLGYQINAKNGVNLQTRNNSTGSQNVVVANSLGLSAISRISSNALRIYKNGVLVGSPTNNSTGISNLSIYLCAANLNNAIAAGSTRQQSFAFVGSGSIDQVKLYSIVQYYLTLIGAAV